MNASNFMPAFAGLMGSAVPEAIVSAFSKKRLTGVWACVGEEYFFRDPLETFARESPLL